MLTESSGLVTLTAGPPPLKSLVEVPLQDLGPSLQSVNAESPQAQKRPIDFSLQQSTFPAKRQKPLPVVTPSASVGIQALNPTLVESLGLLEGPSGPNAYNTTPSLGSNPFNGKVQSSKALELSAKDLEILDQTPSGGDTPLSNPLRQVDPRTQTSLPRRIELLPPSKKFKPLLISARVQKPPNASASKAVSIPQDRLVLYHLDFRGVAPAASIPLVFPPSMAQRRQVPKLAIYLSEIDVRDLKACSLVSRAFRYGAYLGAFEKLSRRFPGKRLEAALQGQPKSRVSFWPYLLQREQEVEERHRAFFGSFLSPAVRGFLRVSPRLWCSPDHEHQITVVIRFILTQVFLAASVGVGSIPTKPVVILDAQEVVKDEIWSITVSANDSLSETVYVLEATCEIIGRAPISCHLTLDSGTPAQALKGGTSLRVDWSAYIERRRLDEESGKPTGSLFDALRWTNHEEYDRGVSRLWLKRVQEEGEMGVAKRVIADRYVLACLVANSVSGQWMSSSEMAQDWMGLGSNLPGVHKTNDRVNLFLPAHHHVESVHLTTTTGHALHPALAVILTPGREYFILKDNGMQVGTEEEGISLVWMGLLNCQSNGRAM